MSGWGRWRIGLLLVLIATAARLAWTLAVPTIPVGDFATYRESALYLAEFGHLDRGFVYMPGLVLLLAALHTLGGDVLAAKMVGVVFGGLAAGPVYLIAARLSDNGSTPPVGQTSPGIVAGLAYALWPAGIAVSSVIGTDIPTAAVILLALALLCGWGPTRPLLAAITFGAAMGLAAYFRAVALPLTLLSAGYWLAMRAGARATVIRTAVAVAMTVVVLLPWGWRNSRQSGEFYLTDSHGGITALMGNDPNTEGTHSRSLGVTFRELTGRTFLMEPHRVTDRVAYALAKQWMAFDPAWTAGMIALRMQRLFAQERGLLYWPVYRPGVVPPSTANWFNVHRPAITGLADVWYVLFVIGVVAGVAFAVIERRWAVLVPVPFALALAATYALFVAEPRYRLTTEVLLFPIFGFGAGRVFHALAALARSRPGFVERRGLMATAGGLVLLTLVGWGVVMGGARLRKQHRWAATVCTVDGQPRLAMWRPRDLAPGSGSPVRAAPPAVVLTLAPGAREARAEVTVVMPGAAHTTTGESRLQAVLSWRGKTDGVVLTIGGDAATATGGASQLLGAVDHGVFARGAARLPVRIARADGDFSQEAEVAISDVVLTTAGAP